MSELVDKEVMHKKNFKKYFRGSHKLLQAHEKVCNENERKKQRKNYMHEKKIFDGRKPFIGHTQRAGKNNLNKLRVNNSGHNKGTMGDSGMRFRTWAHEPAPLNSQWLVLRIGSANFLHCCFTDSIYLELAESLIAKR